MTETEVVTYPGTRAPDRERWVDSSGVQIKVNEWGDEGGRPLMLAHGGFDFSRTYDGFAPGDEAAPEDPDAPPPPDASLHGEDAALRLVESELGGKVVGRVGE